VLVEGAAADGGPGTGRPRTQRWEDYAQTAVDPDDDCTIWYVGDYVKKEATSYTSRIGAFRLPGCSATQ
jgi:CTP synthase (UTP-ammonia lyase)